MTKVQILLDRANFRPGKIDGLGGEFTQKAADRYAAANNIPPGTMLDVSGVQNPYRTYTITDADKQWVGPQASTPQEQEKLKKLLYADLWEYVAERFHCDQNFLHELNPEITSDDIPVGTNLRVPDVEEFKIEDVGALEKQRRDDQKKAAASASPQAPESPSATPASTATPSPTPIPRHLILLRPERLIEVYEGDKMVACFPCTPGSKKIPVPEGKWKVTSNVLLPYFRWDKSVLETGVKSDTAYNLPPGPNNPVGIVWMGINRPSVGMHGTPTPDRIGRNESHGCIRLANWDAFVLCQLIGKNTPVEVK